MPTEENVIVPTNVDPRRNIFRDDLGAFIKSLMPNEVVSSRTMQFIVISQAAIFFWLWSTASFPLIPKPFEVWKAFKMMWFNEGLGQELITSALLNLKALGLATAVSLLLSYSTVIPICRPLVTVFTKGRFLGLIGLYVFFILAFGSGQALKIILLAFGESVFFVTSMSSVVAQIPKEEFDHARTLRMNEWRVVWEVVVLGTLPKAFDVIRDNAAMGWTMLTMVEGISRAGGVGALMLNENKHFNLAAVVAIQLSIMLLGFCNDSLIGWLKTQICPYSVLNLERR